MDVKAVTEEWVELCAVADLELLQVPYSNVGAPRSVQVTPAAQTPASTDVGLQLVPGQVLLAEDLEDFGWESGTLYVRAPWGATEVLYQAAAQG
jgi:hypothetical protein